MPNKIIRKVLLLTQYASNIVCLICSGVGISGMDEKEREGERGKERESRG